MGSPIFRKDMKKLTKPTRSLFTLKSNFWPISPLKLQSKTSKWRQEPIYGSLMLKIVLWAYLTYPHIWLKEHEEKKSFFGPTYYTGLKQKHCLNSVTPSYKKCPASPSGQFPTLPLSFPTQPYDCSDRLSKQSQCRQRRTQGQFLPHPLGIRCPPSQARGSSL